MKNLYKILFEGENIEDKLVEQIFIDDLKNFDKEKNIILDVREELEVIVGEFENSINIPLSQLRERYEGQNIAQANSFSSYPGFAYIPERGFNINPCLFA